ncbi:molybdenum cofactor guanylyltransferase [Microbacterium sp.]|uniref:molybdenum cofactor guanylyltransferase n=1 Tax=Microbacterium sp. TaxID=51671 RepID=UPI003568FB34
MTETRRTETPSAATPSAETPSAATPATGPTGQTLPTGPTGPTAPTAAIILAGGRASRLDGTAKPLLEVGGRTLLDRAVAAARGCDPIVVVGPPAPTRVHVVWTRESPEFGGPVAGIAAGLALIDTADVLLLAADLPDAEGAVALFHRHPPLVVVVDGDDAADGAHGGHDDDTPDGVCLIDASGRMQWLVGRYRADSLRSAAAALPEGGRDASLRSLLAPLRIGVIPAGDLATDVDTWDDLARARAAAPMPRRDGAPDEETT